MKDAQAGGVVNKYGLTISAANRQYTGHEVVYHIVREDDMKAQYWRHRLFVRGLCGAVIRRMHPIECGKLPGLTCAKCTVLDDCAEGKRIDESHLC